MKKYTIPNGFKVKMLPEGITYETFDDKFTFLSVPEEEQSTKLCWVRVRTDVYGENFYSHYTRYLTPKHEERRELRRRINFYQYELFRQGKDSSKKEIKKKVNIFLYNNLPYIVESSFMKGVSITILRVNSDMESEDASAKIPPFIEVGEDISENENYYTHKMVDR